MPAYDLFMQTDHRRLRGVLGNYFRRAHLFYNQNHLSSTFLTANRLKMRWKILIINHY